MWVTSGPRSPATASRSPTPDQRASASPSCRAPYPDGMTERQIRRLLRSWKLSRTCPPHGLTRDAELSARLTVNITSPQAVFFHALPKLIPPFQFSHRDGLRHKMAKMRKRD